MGGYGGGERGNRENAYAHAQISCSVRPRYAVEHPGKQARNTCADYCAGKAAQQGNAHSLHYEASSNARRECAQRHAQSDLTGAQANQVRKRPVQANGRERNSRERE